MSPGMLCGRGGGNHPSGAFSYGWNICPNYVPKNGDHLEAYITIIRHEVARRIYDFIVQRASRLKHMNIQANKVRELVMFLEKTLFESSASEEEYVNPRTLVSRINVLLRHTNHHRQQSLQRNGAFNSRVEPTWNILQFMPPSFGDSPLVSSNAPNSSIPATLNTGGSIASDNALYDGLIYEDHQDVECNMSGIRWFPTDMTRDQSNMIHDPMFLCNEIATNKSNTIPELNAFSKPAHLNYIGGQNDLIKQSFTNVTNVSMSLEDQHHVSLNTSMNIGMGNIDSNINGFDVFDKTLFQTVYHGHEHISFDQYKQTGNRYEPCFTESSMFGNQFGSTGYHVGGKTGCNVSSSVMDTEHQSKWEPSLMPHYSGLPLLEEAVAAQYQITDQSGNVNCSITPNYTSRQFSGCDVQLDSQCQPHQSYALSVLKATTDVNVDMIVNEASCRNYAEYPQRSEAQHQANERNPVRNNLSQQNMVLHTASGFNYLQCNTNIMPIDETCDDIQPLPKRAKIDHSENCIPTNKKPLNHILSNSTSHSAECLRTLNDHSELIPSPKHEQKKLNGSSPEDRKEDDDIILSICDYEVDTRAHDGASIRDSEKITQERGKCEEEFPQTSIEHAALPAEPVSKSREHHKIDCVSLTEFFTPEELSQHITSLRQSVGQSKVKANKRQAMTQSMNNSYSCQLCDAGELDFVPVPIYCTQCASRIRRHAVFYTLGIGGTRYYICKTCHRAICGENFAICGRTFSKSELEKKKNDVQILEPWVQCDKCNGWQHQVCALFNNRMNGEGHAKYTCPNCCVTELERGNCLALPRTAFLGAKDLPRTALSDHIEQRLHRRLEEDKRATKCLVNEEIPNSGPIFVRVVLSVDKKVEVKNNFLAIFREDNFPAEFPYKSKVILLFQNIEGVDVCLFSMYVQEYGSECDFPNRRRVYISYLDSVKYFRPDVKLVTGEALRTFIYHEFLIGYLEYCKNRGFTSCYIWAVPPSKDEDYILYCHPDIQKTPKPDKLREWYMSMLKKAAKEEIVVEITNLYDHFLVSTGESRAKTTITRLPYFDGDYWPGAAEEKLQKICQEGDKKSSGKSASKKSVTRRSVRTTLHPDLSDSASNDMFLIHAIGKKIYPKKENCIMVHLQRACTHCCMFIISGNCWQCKECSNFQLCDKCYEEEQCRDETDRHPLRKEIKHALHPVKILNVPEVTKDEDEIMESDIFDTRHAFLNLCQGNHYQFDTLRSAKYSSMMILYHLHNPTAPAFVTICHVCHLDIEAGRGLRCDVCFEYEICSSCYEKHGGDDHPHKLTTRSSAYQAQSREAKTSRASQVQKLNDLIVHVSSCQSPSCLYVDCRKAKCLFRHGAQCTVRASKGCVHCKKMWFLLQIHSKACQVSTCRVPRCSDLKMHSARQQQQAESRRWATLSEMSRQMTDGVG